MNTRHRSLAAVFISSAIVSLAGCSTGTGGEESSDGSFAARGLAMPDRLSVVTAKEDAPTPKLASGPRAPLARIAATLPTSGDYATDKAQLWVNDQSIGALDVVNEILCMVAQTRASDMVNVNGNGQYIALVNEDKCNQAGSAQAGAEAASNQNTTSSTGQSVSYNRWTVESTRANDTSPQIVRVWIPGPPDSNDPKDGQAILAKLTIHEGVSASKPFGSFEMVFEGYMLTADGPVHIMRGNLRTVENLSGQPQFEFINKSGTALNPYISAFSRLEKASVLLDSANGTSGRAATFAHEEEAAHGFSSTRGYLVAFDSTHFLRSADDDSDGAVDNPANNVCTQRTVFDTQVYNYNLYETDGTLVTLNSGFPFRFLNGNLGHGNIGYWGVWTDTGLSVDQLRNQNIVRETWNRDSVSESYTLKVSAGRLQKRTMSATTLDKITGVELNWWGDPDGIGGSSCAGNSDCDAGSYIAVFDGTDLTVTKSVTWNDNAPPTYIDLATPVVLASTAGDGNAINQQLWFYSEALGGSVTLMKTGPATYDVIYYAETWQSPAAALQGVQLACWDNCPKGGAVPAAPTAWSDLFYNNGSEHDYVVQVSGGTISLIDSATAGAVSWDDITDWSGMSSWPWLQNGSRSGYMVDFADRGSIGAPEDVNKAAVTYAWEMGPNLWNHTVAAVSGSTPVTFSRPKRFNYSYDPADDYGGGATTIATNALFLLEYGGPGQLSGFPWVPEDPACTGGQCRWKSIVSLLDGVVLNDGSKDYLLRGMAKEQRMAPAAIGDCAALSLAALGLTLPDTVVGTAGFTWDDKPNITAAPAVIEGVIQE
jgi:hypothetical protein